MKLEELKSEWGKMSASVGNQKELTDLKIVKMTEMRYKNKIRTIKVAEIAGAVFCCAALLFIVNGLGKLDSWYLMICGIISVMMLILMPALSIGALFKIKSPDISANSYKETLLGHQTRKIQFINVQKLNMCFGALLFVAVLPVIGKLMTGKDIFKSATLYYVYSVGFPFLYYFASWVLKKYNYALAKAEGILSDLKDQ